MQERYIDTKSGKVFYWIPNAAHNSNVDNVEKLEIGMTVRSGEKEYIITDIAQTPIKVDDSFTDYAIHASGLTVGEWVYAVSIDGEHSDGVYKADIVIESISPISFILN